MDYLALPPLDGAESPSQALVLREQLLRKLRPAVENREYGLTATGGIKLLNVSDSLLICSLVGPAYL